MKRLKKIIVEILFVILSVNFCCSCHPVSETTLNETLNESLDGGVKDELLDTKDVLNTNAERNDFEMIKKKMSEQVWESQTYRYYAMDISENPVKDGANYYIESVDYQMQQPSYWPAIRHLEYTMSLAKSYGEFEICEDEEKKILLLGLVDYWIENDYINEKNWYYNQIGVPLDLIDISLMLFDYLGEKRIEKISNILDRGTIGRGVEDENILGSNGTDFVRISISNAILTSDSILMENCVRAINSIVTEGTFKENGIQNDMSYMGNTVLYGGSAYPITYISNIVEIALLFKDTTYHIEDENQKLLIDFILDGQRYFHRNDGVPNFALGRSAYQAKGGEELQRLVGDIISLGWTYRQDELANYQKSFFDTSYIIQDIKYFPIAGTLIGLAKDNYIAVRGYQNDVSMTNIQNDEGVLNYNLSYGSNTCFMDVGDEYSSICEVFDWSMLPGTTTYKELDEELYTRYLDEYNKSWGHVSKTQNDYLECYGKTDGINRVGVIVTPINHDGISGKNIFIIYDNRLFCLGTDFNLENDSHDKNIITTIEQCKAEEVYSNCILKEGESVVNRSFKYKNLCAYDLLVQYAMQSGTISRTVLSYGDADKEATKAVFKCYFDWGKKMNDIFYAYEVSSSAYMPDISIVNICNNSECQLIEFSDGLIVGNIDKEVCYESNGVQHILNPGICILNNTLRK